MVMFNRSSLIRVSLSDGGNQLSLGSYSQEISADGRFIVFTSDGSDVVSGFGPGSHVYIRDVATGQTFTASGLGQSGGSTQGVISDDGRHVVYRSVAPDVVPDDTNGMIDIFVRDLQGGSTQRISLTGLGAQTDGDSFSPQISGQGRFVDYQSNATNLSAGDSNKNSDIFRTDLFTGSVERLSVSSSGAQGDGASISPQVSADGRFVAFSSSSTNLVAGDTNGFTDGFVRDTVLDTTTRITVSSSEAQANGESLVHAVSADGRYIAFTSTATNLVSGDTNGMTDAFLRDTVAGTTIRVNLSSSGAQATGAETSQMDVSSDGRYVVFQTQAANLVENDTNGVHDIFLRDVQAGTTTRLSIGMGGAEANQASFGAKFSADGRFVVFQSLATNLVAGDTNNQQDTFRISLFATQSADYLIGSDGKDQIEGLGGADYIVGAGGNDTLNGGAGMDTMVGGAGADTYYVDNLGDTVVEEITGGIDIVAASASYRLGAAAAVENLRTTSSSGTSALELTGNTLTQEIIGNAGANVLHDGGAGTPDTMIGLGGNDIYRVYNSGDIIVEGASQGTSDRVMAAVDYKLGAGVRVELLTTNGSTSTSTIDLTGNEFAQEITGNAGDNRLEGREGNDTLRGLGGDDTFVFNTKLGASNIDTILDFNAADDRFLLSDAIFTKLNTGALLSGYFRANTTGLAQDANDHIIYETDTGKLSYDADGLGGAAGIQFAVLTSQPTIGFADFVVA
ncbi:hypothetical protein [Mesorhizobium sp. CN2-181]|uniref:hypothetical protein n=1 Tax=Mesorhizobium yinganensis TaxID=3157707 RepID=UPI0032B84A26